MAKIIQTSRSGFSRLFAGLRRPFPYRWYEVEGASFLKTIKPGGVSECAQRPISNSGSLAMFAAIRRASSLVTKPATRFVGRAHPRSRR